MLPVGNKNTVDRVRAFSSERMPHAVLIAGDGGTGKYMLARHIASVAVCDRTEAPCGECRGCHLCAAGTHPDICVCTPDGKGLSVAEVRALRQNAYLKPTLCERKVYIIESADTMGSAAQNALLKVLEEPPSGVVFILLARTADGLLETVRSRCITLSLVPPSRAEAAEYIASVTDYSAVEIDSALETARNNIGVALSFLKTKKADEFALLAEKLLFAVNGSPSVEMFGMLKPYEKDRRAVDSILSALTERISELLRQSCYTHVKEGLTRAQLVRLYDTVTELQKKAESNVNILLLFANLCSRFKSL